VFSSAIGYLRAIGLLQGFIEHAVRALVFGLALIPDVWAFDPIDKAAQQVIGRTDLPVLSLSLDRDAAVLKLILHRHRTELVDSHGHRLILLQPCPSLGMVLPSAAHQARRSEQPHPGADPRRELLATSLTAWQAIRMLPKVP
jgi:hypothetical protein